MVTALHSDPLNAPSRRWSMYAGLYMFACAAITAVLLDEMLTLLGEVIGLPAPYSLIVFAIPALVFGAGAWWAVVERHSSYTYLNGSMFGLITALSTGVVWTVRFIDVWGFEMVIIPIVAALVAFVLGFAIVAGVIAGLSLMYARRRLDGRQSGKTERPG